ncbi:unnamed protein product, partial [Ixodes persulcatus]
DGSISHHRIESRDGCSKEPAAKSSVPEPQDGEPAAGDCHGGSREILARRETDLPGEPCCSTCAQVFVPFLLAGMGSVAASLLLDRVKDWPVYSTYRELFVLIPPLLGLNGNLEMTLVARLSTQVNLGQLDAFRDQLRQAAANVALLQCQSTVVALTACCLALAKGLTRDPTRVTPLYASMLCACGLAAANVASLLLGAFMTTIVLLARKMHLNPDNVAAPIAASLGDLTTLALLSTISSSLLPWRDSPWVTPGLLAMLLLLLPLWVLVAHRHERTRNVLRVGWPPILSAVVVS